MNMTESSGQLVKTNRVFHFSDFEKRLSGGDQHFLSSNGFKKIETAHSARKAYENFARILTNHHGADLSGRRKTRFQNRFVITEIRNRIHNVNGAFRIDLSAID